MAQDHQAIFRKLSEHHRQEFVLTVTSEECPHDPKRQNFLVYITLSAPVTLYRNRLAKPKRVKLRKQCRSLRWSAFLLPPLSNRRGSVWPGSRSSGASVFTR
jgi:hypothetical protein